MNRRFVIHDDNGSLPTNGEAPSFAIRNNRKQLIVMNTIVLLTTSKGFARDIGEDNGFVNKCMLLCKYTMYSNILCIFFNVECYGKVGQSKNRIAT